MPKFLATKGMSSAISDIIGNADNRLVIISPYVQVSNYFREKLIAASKRGVAITLVCRSKDLRDEQRNLLSSIKGLQLLTHDNVHAKCYFNERQMVIGSLNFFEYSDQNNREMGIEISATEDQKIFLEAQRESEEIIQMAFKTSRSFYNGGQKIEKINWKRTESTTIFEKIADVFSHQGFCIRCHEKLQLNPNYPFCSDCYKVWANWEDSDFQEKFCHCCGQKHNTSMRKPLCLDCYKHGGF